MSFDDEFPSLKGSITSYRIDGQRHPDVILKREIQLYCIDKRKVQEAIEKVCYKWGSGLDYIGLDLKKELELSSIPTKVNEK